MTDTIKDAIRASDMPVSKLAELATVPIPSLTRFMRGERSLSLPVVEKLIQVLGIKVVPPATKKPAAKGK